MCGFLDVDMCGTGVELRVWMLEFILTSFALGAEVNAVLKRLICLLMLVRVATLLLQYTSLSVSFLCIQLHQQISQLFWNKL